MSTNLLKSTGPLWLCLMLTACLESSREHSGPSATNVEPPADSAEPSDDPAEPSDDPAEPSDDPAEPSDDPAEPPDDVQGFVAFDLTDSCVDFTGHGIWAVVMNGAEIHILGNEPNALYAVAALPVMPPETYGSGHFEIRGEFPNSRLLAFGNSDPYLLLLDWVNDREILPDEGSVNPFSSGEGYPSDSPVRYTLKIDDRLDCVNDGRTICGGYSPFADDPSQAVEENQILMRVYQSNTGEPTGGVGLPRIYYVFNPANVTPQTPQTFEQACNLINHSPRFYNGMFPAQMIQPASQAADEVASRLDDEPYRHGRRDEQGSTVDWVVQPIEGEGWANQSAQYIHTTLDPSGAPFALLVTLRHAAYQPALHLRLHSRQSVRPRS